MKHCLAALLVAVAPAPLLAQPAPPPPEPIAVDTQVAALGVDALPNDHLAWEITEGLTT
jgi:hypothetical protein